MSYVLGVNLSHDRSACLLKDGQIVVAIEEERLDRFKYSPGFIFQQGRNEFVIQKVSPMKAITYCLEAAGIGLDELDLIVTDKAEHNYAVDLLRRELPIKDKSKIIAMPFPSHHLAHAYSVFYCSPFEESAIIVADNKGTRVDNAAEAETLYYADHNGICEVLKRYRAGKELSLGSMYDIVSKEIGFSMKIRPEEDRLQDRFSLTNVITECGKTMGLAPYGEPRPEWDALIEDAPDQILSINANRLISALLRWTAEVSEEGKKYEQKIYQDLAFKVQEELEKGLMKLVHFAYEKTQCPNLCIVGGVALNSVANGRIVKESSFKNVFILPAANDGGNSIGCAMYGYHHILGGKARYVLESASLGKQYTEEEMSASIQKRSTQITFERKNLTDVAELISEGKVVGWFQRGSEIGPRALGCRSILADARKADMLDHLNHHVKFREPFRPYAPAVLEEDYAEYFTIDRPSPFMLIVCDVRPEKRKVIPATTHVDGTARIQTVNEKNNPKFYQLINEFKKLTGVPVILNTSFNLAGEPIVESPDDAIDCFIRSKIDYLYMGEYLISRIEGREHN